MDPIDFLQATHRLGAPADWDEAAQGRCETLPVERSAEGWRSIWRPTPEELLLLQSGGGVELRILAAHHPVVSLTAVELLPAAGAASPQEPPARQPEGREGAAADAAASST